MNEYGMPYTWAEGTEPTPVELYEWFMSLTSEDKRKWFDRMQEHLQMSNECMRMDHAGRVAMLEQALVRAQDALNEMREIAVSRA